MMHAQMHPSHGSRPSRQAKAYARHGVERTLQVSTPLTLACPMCDAACIWENEHLLGPQHHRRPLAQGHQPNNTTTVSPISIAVMLLDTSCVAPYDLSSTATKHTKLPLKFNSTHGHTWAHVAQFGRQITRQARTVGQ